MSGLDFGTPLLTAVLGSVVTILGREIIEWLRRPNLQVTLDLSALNEFRLMDDGNFQGWAKYVRLKVHNNGMRAARCCESKIEPLDEQENSLFDPSILHWVRKYFAIYRRLEDQFAPISISRGDHEFLDVIDINRSSSPPYTIAVRTFSHRPYTLLGKRTYRLKVTVFSENAEPRSVTIFFSWDGTWEGFNEGCVQLQ